MTDLQLLVLVLAVIYGWECACWLKRGSVGFVTWFGHRWRVAHPAGLLGNQQGGFIFANPFPPLGTVLVGNQFPLSLSPTAALVYVSSTINPGGRPTQTGKLIRFEDIKGLEVRGKNLRVNGEAILKAASASMAEHLADQLRQLSNLTSPKRAKAIEELARTTLDLRAIEDRWREFRLQARPLRLLTNSLFGYLFLFSPSLIWRLGLGQCWFGLLLGLLAFTSGLAILFHRTHKKFFPAADDERFTHFITILLSPATSIRAHDVLSRPLLERFHPLAIARVFCAEEQFRDFAGKVLVELRHPAEPVCPSEQPAARETERMSRELWQKIVEQFLHENRCDPEALLQPPAPLDETCRAYCPRCQAQFTTREGTCPDCGGLALISFPLREIKPKERSVDRGVKN